MTIGDVVFVSMKTGLPFSREEWGKRVKLHVDKNTGSIQGHRWEDGEEGSGCKWVPKANDLMGKDWVVLHG